MENLNINQRVKETHHGARKTRKEGKVPGILYGKASQNTLIEIGALELNQYILQEGVNSVVGVNLDGANHKALIKEVQRDAITRKIIHVDLAQVNAHEKVTANVPITFSGEEQLIKSGAVLQKQKDNIKVKCDADSIPKSINIDVTKANIGDNFKIADVEFASEISILDSLESVIATISYEQKRQEVVETVEEAVEEK
ncbi:50S ribosomal protein L25 [uncultured Clostridium sp.]|jgi:large subunit ribosomal protein L25|uniref:50S ribosomal protein L25 n=1 Tax=uncultured Clostridium sp. TaxID=59620 RepID=UPI0026304A2F|nr:50S ribosomal protein L25 [uncultured Clostridium sp.]